MKILLTTHLFFPDYSAGTEILAFETARELQRLGHEVLVFTGHSGRRDLAEAERFDHYSYQGVEVERFHHADVPMGRQTDVLEMEYNNLFCADHFRQLLRSFRPDVVHAFHLARLSATLIDVCREAGIPVVFTATDFWFVCPLYQLRLPDNSCCPGPDRFTVNCIRHLDQLDRPDEATIVKRMPDWLVALAAMLARAGVLPRSRFGFLLSVSERPGFLMERLNRVARVLVPTRLMERILVQNGLHSNLTDYCQFGLNLDYIPEQLPRISSGLLRVGFIGTLFEHKGIHILLAAMGLMKPEEDIELQVFGDYREQPDYVASLKRSVASNSRIRFCGTFPNSEIGKVLAGLDLLVVPSIWYENTPLVIYSAMAAGCPVIASNLGGMSEVIHHEVNGLLVEPGDVQGLAMAIKRLADDRQLLAQLASRCNRPKSIGQYVKELLTVMPKSNKFILNFLNLKNRAISAYSGF
jgi:glycosyltransferase involved in cell wall biosynthesis